MFGRIKIWAGVVLTAAVGVLYAFLRLRTSQRDDAREERDRQERARAVESEVDEAQNEARQDAKSAAQEREKQRQDKRRDEGLDNDRL